jgi:hypothetical protein
MQPNETIASKGIIAISLIEKMLQTLCVAGNRPFYSYFTFLHYAVNTIGILESTAVSIAYPASVKAVTGCSSPFAVGQSNVYLAL